MRSNQDWTEIDLEALPEDFIPRTSFQRTVPKDLYAKFYGTWAGNRSTHFPVAAVYRIVWRSMANKVSERTFRPSVIPPGATHVHAVRAAGFVPQNHSLLLATLGVMSSLLADFQIRTSVGSEISAAAVSQLPIVDLDSPLMCQMSHRAAQLVCISREYADLWSGSGHGTWTEESPLRLAEGRRWAQIEIDCIVALLLGVSIEELCTVYRTQFPVLHSYERNNIYDANGRKVPGDMNRLYRKVGEKLTLEERTWTHPQSGVEYLFEFPFRSFDREEDMRKAYAHFENLLGDKS